MKIAIPLFFVFLRAPREIKNDPPTRVSKKEPLNIYNNMHFASTTSECKSHILTRREQRIISCQKRISERHDNSLYAYAIPPVGFII